MPDSGSSLFFVRFTGSVLSFVCKSGYGARYAETEAIVHTFNHRNTVRRSLAAAVLSRFFSCASQPAVLCSAAAWLCFAVQVLPAGCRKKQPYPAVHCRYFCYAGSGCHDCTGTVPDSFPELLHVSLFVFAGSLICWMCLEQRRIGFMHNCC